MSSNLWSIILILIITTIDNEIRVTKNNCDEKLKKVIQIVNLGWIAFKQHVLTFSNVQPSIGPKLYCIRNCTANSEIILEASISWLNVLKFYFIIFPDLIYTISEWWLSLKLKSWKYLLYSQDKTVADLNKDSWLILLRKTVIEAGITFVFFL